MCSPISLQSIFHLLTSVQIATDSAHLRGDGYPSFPFAILFSFLPDFYAIFLTIRGTQGDLQIG